MSIAELCCNRRIAQGVLRMMVVVKVKKFMYRLLKWQLLGIVYEVVFMYFIPECIGALSLLFYRMLYSDIKIGKGIKCWGSVLISKSPDSSIVIGDNVRIASDFLRAGIAIYSKFKIQALVKSKILIGNRVTLSGTSITCRTTIIEIEDGTMIGPNVIIVDSDFHGTWPPDNRIYNKGYEYDKGIKICRNVWIGMNSVILKGVTIGKNSIIAAGSVVVNDVPPNVVAGGNPAKVIKNLPLEEGYK